MSVVSSRRARLAPRQKCTPPPPKATCGFGLRRDVEVKGVVEDVLVAIGGRVPHGDTVARRRWARPGSRCPGGPAGEIRDRRGPPEDLLHCQRNGARAPGAAARAGRDGAGAPAGPCDTALRVVSLPATMSRMKNMSSSIWLSAVRSPSSVSTSTVERMVQTSSCGSARFSWPSVCAYSNNWTWSPQLLLLGHATLGHV